MSRHKKAPVGAEASQNNTENQAYYITTDCYGQVAFTPGDIDPLNAALIMANPGKLFAYRAPTEDEARRGVKAFVLVNVLPGVYATLEIVFTPVILARALVDADYAHSIAITEMAAQVRHWEANPCSH